jgi:DNA methylase
MNEQLALHSSQDKTQVKGPAECLGMTFENDEKRREYFLERLREKLQDPEFRKTEGFPIGSDEDILAMSDPPYYTACPNPFLGDFIKHYGQPYDPDTPYNRKPFAVDVSEGKTDSIYKAHAYHTKVPHLAIVPSILHYTEPGDIVLDGFCGSGMTGVAAQWCGTAPEARQRLELCTPQTVAVGRSSNCGGHSVEACGPWCAGECPSNPPGQSAAA